MRDKIINHIRNILRSSTGNKQMVHPSELEKLHDDTLFTIWIALSQTPFKEESEHC
tara:strand:+ start:1062 stop:1229 length:168 start_codon:yes stop_codon:yes gene_type:complete